MAIQGQFVWRYVRSFSLCLHPCLDSYAFKSLRHLLISRSLSFSNCFCLFTMKRGTGDDPLAFLANRKKRTRPTVSSSSSHSRRHEGSSHSSSSSTSASHRHRRSSRDPIERGGIILREGHEGGRSSSQPTPPPSSSSLGRTSNPTADSDALFGSPPLVGASLSQSSTHHHRHNSRHSRSSSLARSASFGLDRRRRRPSEEGETPSSLSSQTSLRGGGGEGRGLPSSSSSSSTPSSQRGFPSSLGNAATPHRQTPTITASFSRSSSLSRGDIPTSQDREEDGYTGEGVRRPSSQGGHSSSSSLHHQNTRRGEVEGSQGGIGGGVDVRALLEEARAPERSMDECFPVLVDLPVVRCLSLHLI